MTTPLTLEEWQYLWRLLDEADAFIPQMPTMLQARHARTMEKVEAHIEALAEGDYGSKACRPEDLR